MSDIFDALQRSEGELLGGDSRESSHAKELLERAERRAASSWEARTLLESPESEETVDGFAARERREVPGRPVALPSPSAEGTSPDRGNGKPFERIKVLDAVPDPQGRLVCITERESPAAEGFRLLGVRIQHLQRERPLKKILVTSTVPQEGKTMVAANLACSMATVTQQRTLVVGGDLRRSQLSQVFGIGMTPGIGECLDGECSLLESIYRLPASDIWVMPAGASKRNALELLQSGKLPEVIHQLAQWFDWIIIDSPPRVADGGYKRVGATSGRDSACDKARSNRKTAITEGHRSS